MHPVYRLRQPQLGSPAPDVVSYSALCEIESCPRRWWLAHGRYEDLSGPYPQPVYAAAIIGSIVHGTLKIFGDSLRQGGDPIPGTAEFAEIRTAFPVREAVRRLRREALGHVASNPRADVSRVGPQIPIDRCITAFKSLVGQAYPSQREILSYGSEQRAIRDTSGSSADEEVTVFAAPAQVNGVSAPRTGFVSMGKEHFPPCPAFLAEVQIEIVNPPVRGIIDLVVTEQQGDTLIEFKTGAPRPEHEDQANMYAALWWRNTRRSIRRQLLVYADHGAVVLPPTDTKMHELQLAALARRVNNARYELNASRPSAHPGEEKCEICPVRQLCDDYWHAPQSVGHRWEDESLPGLADGESAAGWRDLEIDLKDAEFSSAGFAIPVKFANGGQPGQMAMGRLICSVPPALRPTSLSSERSVRLLNVGLRREARSLRVLWSPHSEAFWS